MGNSYAAWFVGVSEMVVASTNVNQYPSIPLEPSNDLATGHEAIIHIIHTLSNANGSVGTAKVKFPTFARWLQMVGF